VRTFAREPTWLAHVILRNLLTAKKLWLRILWPYKNVQINGHRNGGRINIEIY